VRSPLDIVVDGIGPTRVLGPVTSVNNDLMMCREIEQRSGEAFAFLERLAPVLITAYRTCPVVPGNRFMSWRAVAGATHSPSVETRLEPRERMTGMKPSEMFVLAATAIALVIGLRFAPNPQAEHAVAGAFGVCALIYVTYAVFRSGA
jgi:hypothetical protein